MQTPNAASHTTNCLERNVYMPVILIVLCAPLSLENSSRAIGPGVHSTGRCVVLRAVCMYNICGTVGCIVLYCIPIRQDIPYLVGGPCPCYSS